MSEREWGPLAKTGLENNTSKGHGSLLLNWGPRGSCLPYRGLALPVNLFFSSPLFLSSSSSSSSSSLSVFFCWLLLAAVVALLIFKKEERENPGAKMEKKERSYMLEEMVKDVFWGCSPQCVPSWHPLSFSLYLSFSSSPFKPPEPPSTRFYWKCGYTLGFVGLKGCAVHPVVRVTPTSSSVGQTSELMSG